MLHGGGCKSVRCPRCGYEMPEEPAFLGRIAAWFGKRRTPAAQVPEQPVPTEPCPLVELKPGQRGTVVQLSTQDRARSRKLMALGVLPGCAIELERTSPAFVFRMGYARFAVDADMAMAVMVQRSANAAKVGLSGVGG